MQCGIIVNAWLAYALTSVLVSITHRSAKPAIPVTLLFVMIVTGTGITALLEWSRKCVPQEEPPEPPLPADAANGQRYREATIDWPMLPSITILCGLLVVCVSASITSYAQGEHLTVGALVRIVVCVAGACLVASLSRTAMTVTPMALTYRSGPVRIRLSVADMQTCAPGLPDDDPKPRGVKRTTWCKRGERCIEVTMKNGRIYRFGALRPNHICQLIGKPVVADQEAES